MSKMQIFLADFLLESLLIKHFLLTCCALSPFDLRYSTKFYPFVVEFVANTFPYRMENYC